MLLRSFPLRGAALLLLVALASCGTGTHPCPSTATSSGPPTSSTGLVTIDTDHAVYVPGAPMQLTLTDHLSVMVLVTSRITGNCLFFEAQAQVGGTWSRDRYAFCLHQEANLSGPGAQLVPNTPMVYRLDAETISLYDVLLPPGTYRLAVWYHRDPLRNASDWAQAFSQPFRVCTCASCS
jgi:hypothetical protein